VRDAMLDTEVDHPSDSLHRQTRFGRTWFVVKSAVQNAAVVTGLVARGTSFFFKKEDL